MPKPLAAGDSVCESSVPTQVTYCRDPLHPGRSGKSLCSPRFWLLDGTTTWEAYRDHRMEEYYIYICIAWKEWKISYLWESSVRNFFLSKNRELRNSEYLLHCEPNSCISFCYYQLLNVWRSLLLVLLFQLANFTTLTSWLHLTVSVINILVMIQFW